MRIRITVLCACLLAAPDSSAQDPLVDAVASQVSQDNTTAIIQTLEDFGTRYSFTTQCDDAADWIYATMESSGIQVAFEEFEYGGKTLRNVVGRIEGSVYPDRVFIIGAHYDSTSEMPTVYAPGADDNASGVAAVLEAVRILSAFELNNTVEFIGFGGEEQGRQGSQYNAAEAAQAGKNILGMINLDMIGYWPPTSDMELDIGKNVSSGWLANVVENATTTYASILVRNWPNTGVCYDDHVSYWPFGFDAIVLMDCYEAHQNPGGSGETTPYYHTTSDTIATLDLVQTTEAVRAAVAAIALLGQPILAPFDLHTHRIPASDDMRISWSGGVGPYTLRVSTEPDFSTGVIELTPPGGTMATEWLHAWALNDGIDYYYRATDALSE
jgi:Zn-dependent M28 family amino/carboxypeptidase